MRNRIRSLIALSAIAFLSLTAYVFAAAQNRVPKYNSSGSLIDSQIWEVNGRVGLGTSSPGDRLHVRKSTSGTPGGLRITNPVTGEYTNAGIVLENLEVADGQAEWHVFAEKSSDGAAT